jgi:hypothetical protein
LDRQTWAIFAVQQWERNSYGPCLLHDCAKEFGVEMAENDGHSTISFFFLGVLALKNGQSWAILAVSALGIKYSCRQYLSYDSVKN